MRFGIQVLLAKINVVQILPDIHVKVYRHILFFDQFWTKPYCIWKSWSFQMWGFVNLEKWKTELKNLVPSSVGGEWVIPVEPIRISLMAGDMNHLAFKSRMLWCSDRSGHIYPYSPNSPFGPYKLGLPEEFFNLHFTWMSKSHFESLLTQFQTVLEKINMRIALVTAFLSELVVGQTRDGAFNQFLNRVFTRESIEKYDNIQIDFTGLGNPKATIRTIFQDMLKFVRKLKKISFLHCRKNLSRFWAHRSLRTHIQTKVFISCPLKEQASLIALTAWTRVVSF